MSTNADAPVPGNKRIFVAMEFNRDFESLYETVLAPIAHEHGFLISKADSNPNHQNIMATIVRAIVEADLVIAEMSSLNPNVMYEVGIAHALGKRTILLTQDISSAPFDLRAYYMISYSFDFRDVEALKVQLADALKGLANDTASFSNPVQDFITLGGGPALVPSGAHPATTSVTVEANRRTESTPDELESDGIFELNEELNKISTEIGSLAVELSTETASFGQNLELETSRLGDLSSAEPTNSNNVYVRGVIVRTSSVITNYSEIVEPIGSRMSQLWLRAGLVADRIEQIKTENESLQFGSTESANEFLGLVDVLRGSREQVVDLRTNTRQLKGVARDLDRSLVKLDRALKEVIDSMLQGEATAVRLSEVLGIPAGAIQESQEA